MTPFNKLLYLLILTFFIGCSTSPTVSTQSTTNKISILTFSEDKLSATITIPNGPNAFEQALHQLMEHDNTIVLDQYLYGVVENSIVSEIKDVIINSLPEDALDFRIKSFSSINNSGPKLLVSYTFSSNSRHLVLSKTGPKSTNPSSIKLESKSFI